MASSSAETNLATAKTVLSMAASVAATAMLFRSIFQDFLPSELQDHLFSGIRSFFNRYSSQLTIVVDEFDGLVNNQIYDAAETYLATKISPNTRRLKISKPEKENNFNVTMERGEEIVDLFNGVKIKWVFACRQIESKNFHSWGHLDSTLRSEARSFEVSFHKKHKDKVIGSYFPHILEEANSMKQEIKTLKLFTVDPDMMYDLGNMWTSVNLDHPATFDKLAMDSELKKSIVEDLERFVERKDYYRKIGKAWKRGYLLYGPPGTGKSSLIAAMANYLKFDIYDLELTELTRNSELRKILIATANRSILVVEDIDCSIDFEDRTAEAGDSQSQPLTKKQNQVTLSGLLNFIDGLWSSCGDERIIVFTTNHKEKLDPALLRPGRMDFHIHMSYCTPCGFKVLASNYLGIKDHLLFGEIEEAIGTTQVTPAEVAEQLMKVNDPDVVLRDLIQFLQEKKEENEKDIDRKGQAEPIEKEGEKL